MTEQTNAVQPWTPTPVAVGDLLPTGLAEKDVNLLVPTMAIRQINPFLVPDVEMVKLNLGPKGDGAGSKDVYHSNDMKAGEFAPTARALSKIANVAGVDTLDSRRIDEGRDPDVVEWRVVLEMRLPSGQVVRRAGTKRIDLHQLGATQSPAWLGKMRENLIALAETKAFNRALRSLLSLQGAMPLAQLSKPFAILRFVPNMNNPDVRKRMLDNLLPATTQAYGPPAGTVQIGAGRAVEAELAEVEEAPDDEVADGEFIETAEGYVADRNGEVIREPSGAEEPDWFGEEATARVPANATPPPLPDLLRSLFPAGPTAPATDEQKVALRALFDGRSSTEVLRGLQAAFQFAGSKPGDLTSSQAGAVLAAAERLGRDAFLEQWRGLAA